jgi:hypothetical protein
VKECARDASKGLAAFLHPDARGKPPSSLSQLPALFNPFLPLPPRPPPSDSSPRSPCSPEHLPPSPPFQAPSLDPPVRLSMTTERCDGPGEASPAGDPLTLLGQPFIEERMLGLRFQVSGSSFFQVNTAAAEGMYGLLRSLCQVPLTDRRLHASHPHRCVSPLLCQVGSR